MKILVVGSCRWAIYAKAFETGFKNLGHEVRTLDVNKYLYKNKAFHDILNRIQHKYNIGVPILKYNKDLIKLSEDFKPDLVFLYFCTGLYPYTLKRIANMGAKIFTYCNDDPYNNIYTKPWCWKFHKSLNKADWNFVYREKNVEDYINSGITNVSVLLPYYLTCQNYFIPCEKDIPIAFVGHFENDGRDDLIWSLIKNDIPITVFNGSYWEASSLISKIGNVVKPSCSGLEYNKLLNRIRISIIFLSKINHDKYTRRCFEIPAAKSMIFCEYTEEMDRLFPEGQCAVYFRDKEEFISKAKYLLAHPELVTQISKNGYERLLEIGGCETDRCKEIIEKYNELNDKKNE